MNRVEHNCPLGTVTLELASPSIDALIDEALPLIRPKSRQAYRSMIRADLERMGRSMVDHHAGQGRYISLILREESD